MNCMALIKTPFMSLALNTKIEHFYMDFLVLKAQQIDRWDFVEFTSSQVLSFIDGFVTSSPTGMLLPESDKPIYKDLAVYVLLPPRL